MGKNPNQRHLSAERCAEIAKAIRSGVVALDVRLAPGHDLERMAREAEWLASMGPEALNGKAVDDEERRFAAILMMEQAERIAATLQVLPLIQNHELAKKWLRDRLNRLWTQDAEAQDHLFEFEMAGRLARATELTVSLEEPDIVVTLASGRSFLIACKRPRSTAGVPNCIRKAKRQIRDQRNGRPAVILIGTEAIFHKSDKPGKKTVIYKTESPDRARAIGAAKIEEAIRASERETERALADGVAAIMYCGVLVYLLKHPPAFYALILRRGIWNRAEPGSQNLLRQLERILFE